MVWLRSPSGITLIFCHTITRRNRFAWLLVGLAALMAGLGAGPPKVREVRVPASKVTSYFPAGTPLRLMSEAEFRDLLDRARKGAEVEADRTSPSLVVAHHEARWENGTIRGRSELTIEQRGEVPAALPLEPWTPALIGASRPSAIRSLPDGRAAVWIEQSGESQVSLDWSVCARPGSRGHVFDLGLPAVAVSHLDLDLPAGLEPEIHRASRVSSHPAEDSGRVLWRFDGVVGDFHDPASRSRRDPFKPLFGFRVDERANADRGPGRVGLVRGRLDRHSRPERVTRDSS